MVWEPAFYTIRCRQKPAGRKRQGFDADEVLVVECLRFNYNEMPPESITEASVAYRGIPCWSVVSTPACPRTWALKCSNDGLTYGRSTSISSISSFVMVVSSARVKHLAPYALGGGSSNHNTVSPKNAGAWMKARSGWAPILVNFLFRVADLLFSFSLYSPRLYLSWTSSNTAVLFMSEP